MCPSERSQPIDRVRVAATARAVLSNLDLLAGEGLATREHTSVRTAAEALSDADEPDEGPPTDDLMATGAELRARLTTLDGPTSDTLVTWLDDAFGRR